LWKLKSIDLSRTERRPFKMGMDFILKFTGSIMFEVNSKVEMEGNHIGAVSDGFI